jgi:Carboxypeptidase regulatory-like domain/TonB dependent receptor
MSSIKLQGNSSGSLRGTKRLTPFRAATFIVAILTGVLSYSRIGQAQGFYGSITGTVTDNSGAVVPGVTVDLTGSATRVKIQTATNAAGAYSFPNLQPGTYELTFTKSGFKTTSHGSIDVQVASNLRVDIPLEVGDVTETAEVTSETPVLQTEEASLGNTIEGRAVTDMPLNGRNVYGLVGLVPGAVPQGGTSQSPSGQNVFGAGNFQIGGGGANQSSSTLDGAPLNTNYLHNTALVPTQDAIAEFKVQTNNLGPEYGDFLGGVMNMVSKSGTDSFHGSAYEFIRNKVLNANTYFNNLLGTARPAFTQNQYGITLGGPIHRTKTFFFFSWEGFGLRQGISFTATEPTAAQLDGDFSALSTPIVNPVTGQQYMGCNGDQPNVICPNQLDTAGTTMVKSLYPPSNRPGLVNNYSINSATGGNFNQYNARVDHAISEKQRVFGRYTYWNNKNLPNDSTGLQSYYGGLAPEHIVVNQIVLGDTYVFNPSTVGDLRVAFLRYNYQRAPGSLGYDLSKNLGWPSSTTKDIFYPTKPFSIIFGYWGLSGNPSNIVNDQNNSFSLEPSMTKTMGRHTLKFGADLRKYQFNYVQSSFGTGLFLFSGQFSGNAVADALLGDPFVDFLINPIKPAGTQNYQGYYFGDVWNVNNRLTLNLGVRWEIPGPWTERHDRLSVFQPNATNPLASEYRGALAYVNSSARSARGSTDLKLNHFAPRIGAAYRVGNKTVLRAGFGMFYAPDDMSFALQPVNDFVSAAQTTVNPTPLIKAGIFDFANPFPDGVLLPIGRSTNAAINAAGLGQTFGAAIPNETFPYVLQFNAAIERELDPRTSFQLAFAGSQASHLIPPSGSGDMINPLPDSYLAQGDALLNPVPNPFATLVTNGPLAGATIPAGQLLRKYPEFYNITDSASYDRSSTYDALQASVQHRFSGGGTLLGSYTWGKILGNADNTTGYFLDSTGNNNSNTFSPQDPNNLRAERSLSFFDARQRFVASYVLDLPFGKGQNFLNGATGVENAVIGGWGVNGITTFQTGFPISIGYSGSTGISTYFGGGNPRPNYTAGCPKSIEGSSQHRLNQWFNTSCFTAPAYWGYGNEPRADSSLTNAGVANYDFAVFKNTHVTDRFVIQFRTEIFNLFNRVQFAAPNSVLNSGSFGIVSGQSNNPRLFQFALRLNY